MNPARSVDAELPEPRPYARRIDSVLVHETWGGVDDEAMAARTEATLLITARTRGEVEIVARRVHQTAAGARPAPFVRFRARALPIEPRVLEESCAGLLDAAAGGSLLLTDVEEMPAIVQGEVIELLANLQRTRASSAAVRLITGTTVSLLDLIHTGAFSERLFYRLNEVHLVY